MALGRRPTSDFGTVALHWIMVAAVVVLVGTGLRILGDDGPNRWIGMLDPLLPVENLWWRHMIAAVVLLSAFGGYVAYVRKARLGARVRLDGVRLSAVMRPGRGRSSAVGTLAIWMLFAALMLEIVSGTMLYVGVGGAFETMHRAGMWLALGAIGVHIAAHFAYGGIAQLLRILRPARLVVAPPPPDLAELLAEELGRRARPVEPARAPGPSPLPPPIPPLSAAATRPLATTVQILTDAAPDEVRTEPIGEHRPASRIALFSRRRAPAPRPTSDPPMLEHSAPGQSAGGPDLGASRQGSVIEISEADRRSRRVTLNAHPLASAMSVMLALSALAFGTEVSTRQVLRVSVIARADVPRLDGDLSDPVWRLAVPQLIATQHGGDFGGTGNSEVEIRAVHDREFVYLAITWTDPTRSLKHLPLLKQADGWRVLENGHTTGDETIFHEDKFALLLAQPGLPLIGAAIHLAVRPLADRPPGAPGRGLHYTAGGIADLWQWRATRAGAEGTVENCHFGPPAAPTPAQAEGRERYAGGFVCEDRAALASDNWTPNAAAGVLPRRLPRDLAVTTAAMGSAALIADVSEREGARWWMSEAESIPYAAKADARIPVGTLIPSVIAAAPPPRPASIRGAARWAAGRWTLEMVRRLDTGSPDDVPLRSGTLAWVAAFDHAETRHTRHLRPLRLEID